MKAHLLYPDRDFDVAAELPPGHADLIADLGLGTVLEAMAGGDKFLYDIALRVLLASVTDPGEIRYRQDILADALARPDVIRQMYQIAVAAMADKRGLWGYSSRYPASILSGALTQLEALVGRLTELRRIADEHAGTFASEGLAALLAGIARDLDDEYLDLLGRHLKKLRFRGGTPMSARLGRDNSGTGFVLRASSARRGWKERVGIGQRTVYSFAIAPRDEAGSQWLSEMTSRAVNAVANAAAQSADHVTSYFRMLRAELGFYVGCLNLHERLIAAGQPVCFPDPARAGSGELAFCDLRDASLALRAGLVVGNDVDAGGKPLVIITGANSGGKSTFLRSVGTAQLMMQAGLFVTAGSLRASVCHGLFTHFIREEDQTMTSGRLDEELARMSAIADHISPGAIVLFNESFAATNEREGSEIARQVAAALLESGVRVLFVTHLFDFADGFRRERPDDTLFLRAPRQPDGQRTYRLAVADPLPTSYGEDIYYRIGGWLDEHGMTAAAAANGLTQEGAWQAQSPGT